MSDDSRDYALAGTGATAEVPAPELDYRPLGPESYRPRIGLIGCGGITKHHLMAYRAAGYEVVALADVVEERAEERRQEFYPEASVYVDYNELLRRDDIDVVDAATHPPERVAIIDAALDAGKHVLSQKPFVIDLEIGERLVDKAASRGLRLAVNQNGRWAPHFSYIRHAIARGLVGDVIGAHLAVHWDHGWIADTPFNAVPHVILYDFAVHWYDILTCFHGQRQPTRLHASLARSPSQKAAPPLLAQVLIEYEDAQSTLVFDADTRFGPRDRTYVAGSRGSIMSDGPNLSEQEVTLYTAEGVARPKLEGTWFAEGFLGTMAELLRAIEEDREPTNSARSNLPALAMCFAACESAGVGEPRVPGSVRRMPGK